jgi:hypothetical protein
MKKTLFLTALFATVLCGCYYEVNSDVTIKIDNNSSQDLHISFYPNTFTNDCVGVTYKYKDVDVKKDESVSYIVKFRYNEKKIGDSESAIIAPMIHHIEKIIFSNMDTKEFIKEVSFHELNIYSNDFYFHKFVITDELLNTQGE